MKLYYPENLDLTKYLPPKKLKHIEKYHYVLSLLYVSKTYNSRYTKNSFIRLKNNYLRKIVNSRWANVIKSDLAEYGIIEIDHSYKVKRNSKGYRLTDKYRGRAFATVEASEKLCKLRDRHYFDDITGDDERLSLDERLDLVLETYKNKQNANSPKYTNLKNHMQELTIDYPAAMKYIDGIIDEIGQDKYNSYRIAIDHIADGQVYHKIDHRTGRLFTNITNLYKHLRRFLRYQGQELVEVDIANSQPFLFNSILQEMYPHKGKDGKENEYKDVEKYERNTKKGRFYDHLLAEINRKTGKKLTREKFKPTAFGKIFFCQSKSNFRYIESKIFRELYPNVFKCILHEKRDDYRNLALKLQKHEADIMIDKIAIPLSAKMPIFTIHDSILTTKKNLSKVKKFIQKTFADELGIVPTLK